MKRYQLAALLAFFLLSPSCAFIKGYFSVVPETPREDWVAALAAYTTAAQSVADWEKANPGDHTEIHKAATVAQALIDQTETSIEAGTITDAQLQAATGLLNAEVATLKEKAK